MVSCLRLVNTKTYAWIARLVRLPTGRGLLSLFSGTLRAPLAHSPRSQSRADARLVLDHRKSTARFEDFTIRLPGASLITEYNSLFITVTSSGPRTSLSKIYHWRSERTQEIRSERCVKWGWGTKSLLLLRNLKIDGKGYKMEKK